MAKKHAASPEWCEDCQELLMDRAVEREMRQEGEYVRRSRAWHDAEEQRIMAELES